MNYTPGAEVTGTISKIAFGGQGILRTDDNFVIFVPYTAPQDTIVCRLKKVKKSYAEGDAVKILAKSPFRTVPKCPYFGRCGGCQLQHISYPEQLEAKKEAIHDALRKFAGCKAEYPITIHASEKQWHYRRHIHLTLKAEPKGYSAGYIADDHHTFLPIELCPIFVSMDNPIIAEVQKAAASLASNGENAKVMIVKQPQGFLLHFHFRDWSESNFKLLEAAKKEHPHWEAVIVSSKTKTSSIGSELLTAQLGHLTMAYSSSSFMQNHPDESMKIYEMIAAIAEKAKPRHALDLYCGIGISTLFLAGHAASLLGIEDNAKAVELAQRNARDNGIHNVSFTKGKVERQLEGAFAKQSWDFVLLNPPRIGVEKKVIQILLANLPKNIIFVSCMPSTLGRDLKYFLENGYEIQQCQAFDMFPQTAHVETLVHLQRIHSN